MHLLWYNLFKCVYFFMLFIVTVSFQENDKLSTEQAQRELPTMLRRASIAPLAAKIRSNRPPTAPPGSIFLKNTEPTR